jgi:hypothetical protein
MKAWSRLTICEEKLTVSNEYDLLRKTELRKLDKQNEIV